MTRKPANTNLKPDQIFSYKKVLDYNGRKFLKSIEFASILYSTILFILSAIRRQTSFIHSMTLYILITLIIGGFFSIAWFIKTCKSGSRGNEKIHNLKIVCKILIVLNAFVHTFYSLIYNSSDMLVHNLKYIKCGVTVFINLILQFLGTIFSITTIIQEFIKLAPHRRNNTETLIFSVTIVTSIVAITCRCINVYENAGEITLLKSISILKLIDLLCSIIPCFLIFLYSKNIYEESLRNQDLINTLIENIENQYPFDQMALHDQRKLVKDFQRCIEKEIKPPNTKIDAIAKHNTINKTERIEEYPETKTPLIEAKVTLVFEDYRIKQQKTMNHSR